MDKQISADHVQLCFMTFCRIHENDILLHLAGKMHITVKLGELLFNVSF